MRRGHTETPARHRPPDRFAWIGVPVRITLGGDRLTDFQGQIIGFDRSWVKVRFGAKRPRLSEGTGVRLQFGPSGRQAMLPLQGIVWRVDPDGDITVLLSLSTPEFQRLKKLAEPIKLPPPEVGAHSPPAPPHPPPAEGAPTPSPGAPEESMEASGEPADRSPSLAAEVAAETVGASAERASSPSLPDEGPKAAPVEPLRESPPPAPDYKAAARSFLEGLRAQPVSLSLWCALGATMYQLGKKKAAAEILQHVVRQGRLDSPEVRLARSVLGRIGAVAEERAEERHRAEPGAVPRTRAERVELPPARPAADPAPRTETNLVEVRRKPSGRPAMSQDEFGYFEAAPQSRQSELPTAPPQPAPPQPAPSQPAPSQPRARRASPAEAAENRAKPPAQAPQGGKRVAGAARRGRSSTDPAAQAALLAKQGNFAEAARLYAEALQATPENATLWYALGVTLRHLNKPQEAAEALQRVIQHGEPESLVRLARLWLERGGVGGPDRDGP